MAAKRKAKKQEKHIFDRIVQHDTTLDRHGEDKVLLFATGMLFGIGISLYFMRVLWFTGLTLLIFALVLLYIESRNA